MGSITSCLPIFKNKGNIFFGEKILLNGLKMSTISTSVRSAMKITNTVAKNVASSSSKISSSRGSFFDQESHKLFLDKHQQKNTPNSNTWTKNSQNSYQNNKGK